MGLCKKLKVQVKNKTIQGYIMVIKQLAKDYVLITI